MNEAAPEKIYTLNVELLGSKPPIWRRIQVADTTRLSGLHEIIQTIMPWENDHLHEFELKGARGGGRRGPHNPFNAMFYESDEMNESSVVLGGIIRRKGQKLLYTYDLGDCWRHQITVEATGKPEPGARYPVCTAGKRACPPEDCGGMWGYYNMLEAVADPDDEDHEHFLEWLGEGFDPEAFDLESVNKRLKAYFG